MLDIKNKYNCLSGISEHSLGSKVPLAAAALGASVIEKHFIKSNFTKSVDSFFSLNPKEFKKMIEDVRLIEKILGQNTYKISNSSKINFAGRRSLYISKKMNSLETSKRRTDFYIADSNFGMYMEDLNTCKALAKEQEKTGWIVMWTSFVSTYI